MPGCGGHELPGLVQAAEVQERGVVDVDVGEARGVGVGAGVGVWPRDHDDHHDDGVGGEHEPVRRLRRGAAGEQVGGLVVAGVAAEHLVAVRGAGPRPAPGVRLRGAPGRHRRVQPRAEARRGRLRQRLQGLHPRRRRQGRPRPRRRQEAQPAQHAGPSLRLLCFSLIHPPPLVAVSLAYGVSLSPRAFTCCR